MDRYKLLESWFDHMLRLSIANIATFVTKTKWTPSEIVANYAK